MAGVRIVLTKVSPHGAEYESSAGAPLHPAKSMTTERRGDCPRDHAI